ncbi:ribonuclease toxin immunity protein CdiI [Clostridium septicum]|uniref:ribonuclease toxin immunity protein CdiI n=1 Tax=Clostridium septicum TaxID=1504 RepID=UPI00196B3DB0|nr:ribonuclease toxin immunity protein CdiI [Clostridium septicum]
MKITNKEDINKYIKYYYEHIGEKNLLKALTNYSDSRGFGIEDIWCCFANEYEEWEEDYFGESGVAYYFDYPAVDKDCIVILTYEEFYKCLSDVCKKYVENNEEKSSYI